MLKPKGYATIVDPSAKVEFDTCNCGHCQRVLFTKPGSAQTVYLFLRPGGEVKEEMGAFCRVCMRPVCLQCHDVGRCTPWERALERAESRSRFLASV